MILVNTVHGIDQLVLILNKNELCFLKICIKLCVCGCGHLDCVILYNKDKCVANMSFLKFQKNFSLFLQYSKLETLLLFFIESLNLPHE